MPDKKSVVKIGPIEYRIEMVDVFIGESNSDSLMGQIDYTNAVIRIRRDLMPDQKRGVLWHEIIHGILYQAGWLGHDHNEGITTAMEYGLTTLFDQYTIEDLYAMLSEAKHDA